MNYREIVKLPSERKMWELRKYYGGRNGALPPTDPRILAMTPELVELEFEHMAYDQQLKKGEVFEDDEYGKYEEETEADDMLLSDIPTLGMDVEVPAGVEIDSIQGEWVDVEIDDHTGESQ